MTCQIENLYPDQFEYKRIVIADMGEQKIIEFFPEAVEFIDQALARKEPILVHCMAGQSRSASCLIAYLMQKRKMKFTEALSFAQQKRPSVMPNHGFIN